MRVLKITGRKWYIYTLDKLDRRLGDYVATASVCTANTAIRFDCDSRCASCSHLIPDRRQGRVATYCSSSPDRRRHNDWIPYSLRLAPAGVGHSPARIRAIPRRSVEALPLILAAALVIFNLLDAALTARALSMGVLEANPIMAGLFNISLPAGMLIKTMLVAAGVFTLWWLWHLPIARRGMMLLTGCYGAVIIYHLSFQLILIR